MRFLSTLAVFAICFSTPALSDDRPAPVALDDMEIQGELPVDPLLPTNMKTVDSGRVFAGKKTTVVDLADQPTFVEPNLRQMFARLPGLFVSDQRIPSIFNVNYRGLGNPHESEFVAFFQDQVPLASDMFGYSTLYYLPPAQRVERVEFTRGGSGLLYGPQIGPSINFVTRRADATAEVSARTEQAFGSDSFYSTYNEARWGDGTWGLMASVDHRQADGQRRNEDYDISSGYLGVDYAGFDSTRIGLDLTIYQSDSGEAGRLSSAEFASSPNLTTTPFNRVLIDRVIATLRWDQQLSDDSTFNARLWHSYQDRFSRRSGQFTPPSDPPATTNLDRQEFTTLGFDARYAKAWGQGHALTLGTTMYRGDSPRTRHVSDDLESNATRAEDLRFEQDRKISYAAAFVENLFTFDKFKIAPAIRLERVNYDLAEPVKNPSLDRDPVDIDTSNTEVLFGLGSMYQIGASSEVYINVSESYRPQRFDDLANPNSELAAENGPDISKALNYEAGIRSNPRRGLLVDLSVFRIDFEDKIEQIQVNTADVLRVNSGDSRHQGIEFSLEYDMLAGSASGISLTAFFNGSLLDAEITRSSNEALVGNTPAFAPDYLLRTGLLYDDTRLNVALTATIVDRQFWQDSNGSRGSDGDLIAAEIPAYEVVDLSAEYLLNARWAVFGGVNNLLDDRYYSRVRNDGIEPATDRTVFAGFRLSL